MCWGSAAGLCGYLPLSNASDTSSVQYHTCTHAHRPYHHVLWCHLVALWRRHHRWPCLTRRHAYSPVTNMPAHPPADCGGRDCMHGTGVLTRAVRMGWGRGLSMLAVLPCKWTTDVVNHAPVETPPCVRCEGTYTGSLLHCCAVYRTIPTCIWCWNSWMEEKCSRIYAG